MEPIDLYLAIVSTLALFIVFGFFCRWWYAEYYEMKQLRARYVRSIAADGALMAHRVTFLAICMILVCVLIYVWVSAWGQ